ncbi:MAG TPA: hypothetical protein VFZ83_03995 [Acidimicrobiia bacterium]|nr:hypothetical protein [Acidimicrobiia bacterium]
MLPSPRARIGLVVLAFAVAGCTGGSPFSDGGTDSTCTLIERLGATADRVERADVSDPDEFQTALDDAVAQFVEVADDLLDTAPDELHDDLRALKAAAEQYRFADAVEARATLDEYAARECGLRAPSTTTSTVPPTVPTTAPTTSG